MTGSPRSFAFVAVFLLGGLCGGALSYFYLKPTQVPVAEPVVVQRDERAARPAPVSTGVVTVVFSGDDIDYRRTGVALAGRDVLLVRLDDFVTASSAYWLNPDGRRHALGDAIAYDFDLGIAAFASRRPFDWGLRLSGQDGSLFLGRDLYVVGNASRVAGYVDSAAIEGANRGYFYRIRVSSDTAAGSALVTRDSGELIGLSLTSATTEGQFDALDAAAIRDLLDHSYDALSVSELGRRHAQSFRGLLATLGGAAAAGRWPDAANAAELLATHFGDRLTPEQSIAASDAYLNLAVSLRAGGDLDKALATVRAGVQLFGADADLTSEHITLLEQLGRIDDAIATGRNFLLGRGATARSQPVRDALRVAVLRSVQSDALSDAQVIGVLIDALEVDDYARYHLELGERLFAAGNYRDAQRHLTRAAQLEPSYSAQVERQLRQSAQRQDLAGLIEVPLGSNGRSLFVDVRLNGRSESYRFLLDTGASYTAINHRTLLRLGLNDVFARGAPLIELETAAGRVYAGRINLASIDAGGALVRDVPVVILEDMGNLDGLLGLSFLNHFDVDIDQRAGKLLLTPR